MTPEELGALKASKTFCFHPWGTVTIRANGDVYPCCAFDAWGRQHVNMGSLRKSELQDIWNSMEWRGLRRAMLEGREIHQCKRCYMLEAQGFESERQRSYSLSPRLPAAVGETKTDGSLERMEPVLLDLRFSNLCNYKCRTCGPDQSTSWVEDYKQLRLNAHGFQLALYDEPWRRTIAEEPQDAIRRLAPLLSHLEEIHFLGGEPLIMQEHYDFLAALISEKKTNVRLHYNTNFSTTVFKGIDVCRLWNEFEDVTVSASLDGMGRRGEYLRKNQDWLRTVENRKQMLRVSPRARFHLAPTLNLMNALHVPDFHREWLNQGYIEAGDLLFSPVLLPEEYSVQALPERFKKAMADKYERHIRWLRGAFGAEGKKDAAQFASAIRLAQSSDKTHLLSAFRARTRVLDKIRGERFEEVFPELSSLMSEISMEDLAEESRDAQGRTSLGAAARKGDAREIDSLLDRGADLEARDKKGRTPLIIAAECRKTEVIRRLVERGADKEAQDDRGLTPLLMAVVSGSAEAVSALLASGASVHARDDSGWTALMIAAERGRVDLMEILLKFGADIGAMDGKERDALTAASGNGRTDAVAYLLSRGAGARNKHGMRPLWAAAERGYADTVRQFLAPTHSIGVGQGDILRAAGLALLSGRMEVYEVLSDSRPDAVSRAKLLDWTAQELLDLSIKGRGLALDVASRDGEGRTSLMNAAALGDATLARALLNAGADLHACDFRNQSALILSAERGHGAVARLLLERGADIEARNFRGHTALMRAADFDFVEMACLLLDHGADIEARDESGRTPLMFAAEAGRLGMMDCLLARGADIEARDDDGHTSLMYAAMHGRMDAARFLLERGAPTQAIDNGGHAALMLAEAYSRGDVAGLLRDWEMAVQN